MSEHNAVMQFFHWYTSDDGNSWAEVEGKQYAYGEQVDYLDHWTRIGWVRLGDEQHPKAMAVLLSDKTEGTKWMGTNRPEGTTFRDVTGHVEGVVTVNADGFGEFRCNGGSVSVWVQD